MSTKSAEVTELVKNTIYRACLLLDDEKWNDWLDLCDDSFQYAVTAWSPEIRSDMIYLSGDRAHMKSLTDMLPKHNTDNSPLRRHTTVYTVDENDDGTVTAVSSLAVYQNMLNGINSHIDAGESHLFLIGRYVDKLKVENGEAKFIDREVKLDTRRLDKGSHWPI